LRKPTVRVLFSQSSLLDEFNPAILRFAFALPAILPCCLPFWELRDASHRQSHQSGQTANLRIGHWPMPLNRFFELILPHGSDVLCPSHAVFTKTSLSRAK
jgi:hypothetical protein